MTKTASRVALVACVVGSVAFGSSARAEDQANKSTIECSMTFSLKGWSAFYKTAKGTGQVKCSNGQSMAVEIKSDGGGLTFGKSDVKNGTGKFSGATKIDDVLGSYAYAAADAGAVKSSAARVMTKGEISLALAGTGEGFDLGVDAGKFTITKAGAAKK
jgi:hypothetical protein